MNKLFLGLLSKVLAVSFLLATAVLVHSAVIGQNENVESDKKKISSSSQVSKQTTTSNLEEQPAPTSDIIRQQLKSEEELALAEEAKFEQELKAISVPEYSSTSEFSKTSLSKMAAKASKVAVSSAVSLAGLNNNTNAAPQTTFNQDEFLLAKEEPFVENNSIASSAVADGSTNLAPEQTGEPENNPALAYNQQPAYSSVEPADVQESRQHQRQATSSTVKENILQNVEVLPPQSTSAKDLAPSGGIKQKLGQKIKIIAQANSLKTKQLKTSEQTLQEAPTVTVPTTVNSPDTVNSVEFTPKKTRTEQNDFAIPQKPVVVSNSTKGKPDWKEIQPKLEKLRNLDRIKVGSYYSSPGLNIYIPSGYGSHRNTAFVVGSYQSDVRFSSADDGAIGFGVGLGDANKSVGVVLSYTAASFGGSRHFGSGGFNVKVHRRFKDWSAAVGMNGFLNVGGYKDSSIEGVNDFENSLYAVATKIFRTRKDINKPFSRVAVTAGIGNGQFRTEESFYNDEDNFNVFGNVAVRVHPQASLIAEWTGQDLALGASIAPFKNIPFVITPAVRDIAGPGQGASDRARFILGAGFGFKL